MNQRLVWLDVLKGWGILFIVLGHIVGAGAFLSDGAVQGICTHAFKYFYAFHVPLFFFVAGLTFRKCAWLGFIKGKAMRLLVPYFVFGLFSLVVYWLLHDVGNTLLRGFDTTGFYAHKAQYASFSGYLLALVSGLSWGPVFAANSVLWFIPVLFSLEMVAQAVTRVITRRWAWLAVGVALWCVSCMFSLPALPWGLAQVPKFFLFFVFGVGLGVDGVRVPKRWALCCGGVLVVVFGLVAIWNPYQYFGQALWQHAFTAIITCGNIAGWVLLAQAWPCRAIALCGYASLGIMVLHKFPMLLLQNAFPPVRALFQGGILPLSAGIVIVFVGVVGGSLGVYLACVRWCPLLFGNARWPLDYIKNGANDS